MYQDGLIYTQMTHTRMRAHTHMHTYIHGVCDSDRGQAGAKPEGELTSGAHMSIYRSLINY
jgi:hypothetical protein